MSTEKQKTILLVEDEAITAMTEKMTLEKFGYKVIIAISGEDAVEAVVKTPAIDLVLMDINLGAGIDGTEAAALILSNRDLPVVFLSNHIEPEVVAKTEKITSYGYVVKNSSITVLDASIKMAFKLFEAKVKEKEKEKVLQDIIDKNPLSMQIVDKEGFTLKTNRAHTLLFGAVPPADFSIFNDSQLKQKGFGGLIERIKNGEIVHFPDIHYNAHDSVPEVPDVPVWIRTVVFPINDSLGKPENFVFMHENITERKQAESQKEAALKALWEREAHYRALVENASDLVYRTDKAGHFTFINQAALAITGYQEGELIGKHYPTLIRPDMRKKAVALFGRQIAKGINNTYSEFPILTKDGREVWLGQNSQLIAENGQVTGFQAVSRDITERKRADGKIKDLAKFPSENPFPILRLDKDGVVLYANEASAGLLQHWGGAVGSHAPRFWIELVAEALSSQSRKTIIIDFNEQTYSFDVIPILAAGYVNIYGNNITERKRMEEALKKSQLLLQSSIESPKDMIILSIDKQYQYLFFNTFHKDVMMNAYGKDVELGMNLLECISNDGDRRKAKINYDRALAGERHITIEEYGDLDRYFYETRYNPIINDQNEVIGATAFSANISERMQVESKKEAALDAQRTSQELIEGIINTIPVRVFWKDMNLVYLGCNAAFARDAGFADPKDIIGKDDFQIGRRSQAELYRSDDRQVIESGRSKLLIEEPQTTPEGRTITILTNKLPLRNSKGEINGVLGTYMDISERKQAEEEIKRQLAEKEILLKEVHHRIKNNIASIEGLLSLHMQAITNPEAIAVLQDAIGRVNSMGILYDKLLLTEDYKDVSVKNYIESIAETVIALFPVSAMVTLDKRIADFQLDSKRLFPLGIIINELITNKMKYAFTGRDAGKIKISLTKDDKHVKLTIQDNGNGLPDGFDINKPEGFGLKLVKMLSQQLGGSFLIEDQAVGTRSVVEFNV
jgi:PAS domain S-box-containing protein